MQRQREPVFNVPLAVVIVVGVLAVIHGLRLLLPELTDLELVFDFGFIPARVTAQFGGEPLRHLAATVAAEPENGAAARMLALGQFVLAGGLKPWTSLSYAFLHGEWTHLIVNCVWLLAFGTAVARRFGSGRFLGFLALTAIGGAVGHWIARPDEVVPMIGASAAVSGCMAGAIRFVFQPGAPLASIRAPEPFAYRLPALPLGEVLRNGTVLTFLGIWFALNLITGLGSEEFGLTDTAIAWEAHIGGFITGLLAFPLFDPKPFESV